MPMRQGGMFASRCPTWLRDHFWRRIRTPPVEADDVERVLADVDADHGNGCADATHGMAPCNCEPRSARSYFREHGRTIPLPEVGGSSAALPTCLRTP